jgi:hypothetical protein
MGHVKTNPMKLKLIPETVPLPASAARSARRFLVVVECAAGVCVTTATAESPNDAVEAFMTQSPGCEDGEIALFDREEQRIVASVKWAMDTTENGLRVPHRQNVFHDWHLALIALEVQNCREVAAAVELSA